MNWKKVKEVSLIVLLVLLVIATIGMFTLLSWILADAMSLQDFIDVLIPTGIAFGAIYGFIKMAEDREDME